jgi:YidC/Oxa1 family membrane protein insertase
MTLLHLRMLLLWLCLLLPLPLRADINIETETLILGFNDQGSLVQATACYPQCGHDAAHRLELSEAAGIVAFGQDAAGKWVQRQGLPQAGNGRSHLLHFTGPGGQAVTWNIPARGYLIQAVVEHTGQLELRSGEQFRARPAAGFGGWLEQVRYVSLGSGGTRQIGLDEDGPVELLTDWAGFRNRFWAVLTSGEAENSFALQTGPGNGAAVLRRSAVPAAQEQHFFYVGPVELDELVAVDEILADMFYAGLWFWLRWICFALYFLLGWIQSLVPSWGLAIMLLSAAVNIVMLPLSRIADRVQQQVNATEARLAPELSRIKQTYRGEEQASRIISHYRSESVHPLYSLKSLLGIAIVIPVFIAAFDMLAENIHLLNTTFLWVNDLSQPDALAQLPFNLPFFGSDLNLLPLLMTGLSVVAAVLHRPAALDQELRSKQVRNMLLLAGAFFALFYTFPAGMVLYWTSNNLIAVGKGLWTCRRAGPSPAL